MTARAAILRVHLVLALGLGAVLALLAASGAVLVFRDELEPLVLPPVTRGPAQAPLQALVDSARQSQPGLRARALILPDGDERPARVAMEGRPGEAPEVLVDPYSGRVLGARWRERSPLHALRLLHADLYLGAPGRSVVGMLGLAFLLQGLTGAYLWKPFARRPARGFAVRWTRAWPVVGYDVHKAVGALSLAFNVPIALTGALLGLSALAPAPDFLLRAAPSASAPTSARPPAARAGAAPGGALGQPMEASGTPLSVDAIVARAAAVLPGRVVSVTLPADAGGAADRGGPGHGAALVRVQLPGDLERRGTGLALIEPSTGAVLAMSGGPGTPIGRRLWDMVAPVHHGDFGGAPVKLLYVAGGLTAPVLVLTGYAVRLGRRRGAAARLRPAADRG